jgi:hypothetical protein
MARVSIQKDYEYFENKFNKIIKFNEMKLINIKVLDVNPLSGFNSILITIIMQFKRYIYVKFIILFIIFLLKCIHDKTFYLYKECAQVF